MLRIASSPYLKVGIQQQLVMSRGYKVRFRSVERAYNWDADPEAVLASAGNEAAIKEVNDYLLSQINDPAVSAKQQILYLIADEDEPNVCKVGISYQPAHRLTQLQINTWRRLKLAALFCPVTGKSERMEQWVLAEARKREKIIRGEWLSLSLVDATAIILDRAKAKGKRICGPDVWFDNLAARVSGLREAQVRQRSLAA